MVSKILRDKGLKLKHQKTRISSRSNPKELMEVTGLWVNRGVPRLNSAERRAIRTEVYRCRQAGLQNPTALAYHKAHGSVSGKVAMLSYLGHAEAARLRQSLGAVLPEYDQSEMTKTVKIVEMLGRTSGRDREKYSFNVSFFKTLQRLNVVARTDPKLAIRLRKRLSSCRPTKHSSATLYDEPI